MSHEHHQTGDRSEINCRVITVSDSRSLSDDPSGDLIAKLLVDAGYSLLDRLLVKDDPGQISTALDDSMDADAVVLTGGTGLTERDITWKVIEQYADEPLPAFATLFTQLSYQQVGAAAVLSRARAGVCRAPNRVIFALPGSSRACELAVKEIIVPQLAHLLKHLSN